jgi:hypothetical protein
VATRTPFDRIPPLSTIEAATNVIQGHVNAYFVLLCVTTALVTALVTASFVSGSRTSETAGLLMKIGGSSSSLFGGGVLFSWLRWKRRFHLCCDLRAQVALRQTTPASVDDEVLKAISIRFWKLYNTWWER